MHFILWIWHSLKIKQRIFSYTFSFFFLQSRSTLHWNDKWNSQFLFFFLLSRSFWRRKCCWIYYFFHLPASLISLAVFLYRHRFKSQINFNYHTVKRHLQHPKILIRFARNAVVLWYRKCYRLFDLVCVVFVWRRQTFLLARLRTLRWTDVIHTQYTHMRRRDRRIYRLHVT